MFEDHFTLMGKAAHVHRITDTAEVRGLNKTGFTKEQPSDFIVTENGVMYYAEVKSSSNPTSFPLSQIERGQRSAMIKQTAAGGLYFLFIHCLTKNIWFKVPAGVVLNAPKASLPWSSLNEYQWSIACKT
ncbi:hypothetical protein P409_00180 [Inquilinus limosus MP06]|uniref:Holliday junction resolvase RecU n=1 Tax=Inquilinus limosus MP06 TaxID=1398085 RepID=A0A0A0DDX8_9PROT|nr:hypothetical protein P409_00180 [Inquilinus limosus MP06]